MILERIRRLLALAVDKSTTEEEARTAALQVARLLVEHKIELTLPSPADPVDPGIATSIAVGFAASGLDVRLSTSPVAFCFGCGQRIPQGRWLVRVDRFRTFHLACYRG